MLERLGWHLVSSFDAEAAASWDFMQYIVKLFFFNLMGGMPRGTVISPQKDRLFWVCSLSNNSGDS